MTTEDGTLRRAGVEVTARSERELQSARSLGDILVESLPGFGDRWDVQVPLFLTAPSMARMLWLDSVYRMAIDVPGHLLEFGSQWGASFNALLMLKLIHEPWNAGRTLVSFSNFEQGFVSIHKHDGSIAEVGDYSVKAGWDDTLRHILETHAQRSPIGAQSNFSIVPGDVSQTLPVWLEQNPGALISHAHFDLDVYEPTRDALNLCLSRMPNGAILIFDELNHPSFPGETLAVMEVLGLRGLALRKSKFQPYSSYCIVDQSPK